LIASAVGGARELVRENETGALVPPRDADALANALERLLRDKELRERMGNEGKARVEREFTMTHQVARYQAIYDALKR
jgi:glycosyltransferase involved in cell wall biosynthesis